METPDGGSTIFDFNVKFIGLSGIRVVTSLIVYGVSRRELTIAFTSVSRVCNGSSVRHNSWVLNKKLRIVLALQICCYQIPPNVTYKWRRVFFPIDPFPAMLFQILTA